MRCGFFVKGGAAKSSKHGKNFGILWRSNTGKFRKNRGHCEAEGRKKLAWRESLLRWGKITVNILRASSISTSPCLTEQLSSHDNLWASVISCVLSSSVKLGMLLIQNPGWKVVCRALANKFLRLRVAKRLQYEADGGYSCQSEMLPLRGM